MYLIVDQKTTEAVIANRPLVTGRKIDFVPELVKLMAELSTEENQELSVDKRVFWRVSIADLSRKLQDRGFAVSNGQIGFATKNLGLEKIRRNYGFIVIWGDEQLEILKAYYDQCQI